MYIGVKLEDGTFLEYWGVRSWDKVEGTLWIYFLSPILEQGSNVGFLEGAKVVSSFIYSGTQESNPENLKLLK